MKTTLDIQRRLTELGFDSGPIDGVRGRKTITAVKRYQSSSHLEPDGIVGPDTLRALFGGTAIVPSESPDAAPWLDVAWRMKGLHERRDNAALREFLKSDGGTIGDPAKIPWCGDFVQTCVAIALPDEPLPSNPYAAINWMKFGREKQPQRGAILIFWRGSPDGWEGHVGFYVSEDQTHFHVLGGNQTDSVTVSRIAKGRMRKGGCRWPITGLAVESGAVQADGSGLMETRNEA